MNLCFLVGVGSICNQLYEILQTKHGRWVFVTAKLFKQEKNKDTGLACWVLSKRPLLFLSAIKHDNNCCKLLLLEKFWLYSFYYFKIQNVTFSFEPVFFFIDAGLNCNQLNGHCKSEMCNFLMAPVQAIFFLRSRMLCIYTDDAWSGFDFYRLFFLRSIAQFFTQIYMNCFVSS